MKQASAKRCVAFISSSLRFALHLIPLFIPVERAHLCTN
jgi:hypothetical protein